MFISKLAAVVPATVLAVTGCASGRSHPITLQELATRLQRVGLVCVGHQFGDESKPDIKVCTLGSGETMVVEVFPNREEVDSFRSSAPTALSGTTSKFLVMGRDFVLQFGVRGSADKALRATGGSPFLTG